MTEGSADLATHRLNQLDQIQKTGEDVRQIVTGLAKDIEALKKDSIKNERDIEARSTVKEFDRLERELGVEKKKREDDKATADKKFDENDKATSATKTEYDQFKGGLKVAFFATGLAATAVGWVLHIVFK